MKAALQQPIAEGVFQETAQVISGEPLRLQSMGLEFQAQRAASCLLKPKAGDEVLVAHLPDRRVYVLAVLTREGQTTELHAEGDLHIQSSQGRIDLRSSQGIGLSSAQEISASAARISVRAIASAWMSESMTVVAKSVASELEKVHLKAGALDTVLGRLTQKAKRVIRVIEETDHLRAERIDYAVQKSVMIQGENTVVTAKQLVKVDGDQIHLG